MQDDGLDAVVIAELLELLVDLIGIENHAGDIDDRDRIGTDEARGAVRVIAERLGERRKGNAKRNDDDRSDAQR